MTTLVIHGTLAQGSSWYWNSWHPGGFCYGVAAAMEAVSGSHDVWRVKGQSIAAKKFGWSGALDGLTRGDGAHALVQYLNQLRQQTDEPIRIIAHSHGCNVVKLASSLPALSRDVRIDKAVFLACPHFWEKNYAPPEVSNWMDKFKFERLQEKGRKYRYKASPQRFGKILNLYSKRDHVQMELAVTWSTGVAPQSGNFLQDFWNMLSTGDVYELSEATRIDSDPDARGLYEDFEVPTSSDCGEVAVHTAMHGFAVATLCGAWLNSNAKLKALISKYGQFPGITADDTGA